MQRMALHLLMYFTHWINLHNQQPDPPSSLLTEVHACWIFSLLSRVEDNLTADDVSLLRSLARACLALLKILRRMRLVGEKEVARAGHGVEVESLEVPISERSCWIIISIVVGVWGQRDLWMDSEAMLASTTES